MGKFFDDLQVALENDRSINDQIDDTICMKEDADEEMNVRLLGQYSAYAEDMEDDDIDSDLGEDTDEDIDELLDATADEDDGTSMGSDINPAIISDAVPEDEYDDEVDGDFFDDADDDDL